VLLFEADEIDHFESVDDSVARKIDALLAHRSQWRSTMEIDELSPDADAQRTAFADRVIGELRDRGMELRGAGAYEGFKRLTDL
jgi:hypothetical protein